ncbi:MAG: hypothetical protein ACRENA_08860 [Vulcanimicrobiaceae bacterium]
MRRLLLALSICSTLVLAACGGGGGGGHAGLPGAASNASGSTTEELNQISAVESITTVLQGQSDYSMDSLTQGLVSRFPASGNSGCVNGTETFVPDKHGDSNSTEAQVFFDTGCTILAHDVIRIWTSLGAGSERVNRTVSIYAPRNPTPIAVRIESNIFTNASFTPNGYPKAATGYDEVDSAFVALSGVRYIIDGSEQVMVAGPPASPPFTRTYCTDSAGFNATGFPHLGVTYGYQNGIASGSYSNNGGSETYTATRVGMSFSGAIGGLNLGIGTQNTSCPISNPMLTITGGTQMGGTNTYPFTSTYTGGVLSNLTVSNATVGGYVLNIATDQTQSPTNPLFIYGTATKDSATATISVDAFGNGTLTTSSGRQYVITDWHVLGQKDTVPV